MAREISANGFKYIRKDVVLSNKRRGIKSAIDLTNKIDKPGADRPCILAEKLYADKELVDLKILCDGKTFECHKVVLSCQSEVFKTMIKNKDLTETKTGIMKIEERDISYDNMEQLLYYLYHEKIKDISIINPDLLVAADKYIVKGLLDKCSKYFEANLSLQNALDVLVTAEFTNQKNLFEAASRFVGKNIGSLNKSRAYEDLLKNNPTLIANVLSKMLDVAPGSNPANRMKYPAGRIPNKRVNQKKEHRNDDHLLDSDEEFAYLLDKHPHLASQL